MLKIVTYPSKILETPSENVNLPLSEEHLNLVREMWETVEGKGVGLAAPQVGQNLRMCIVRIDKEIASKGQKELDFLVINPEITFYSAQESEMIEGCLSFPDQYYRIWRPSNIKVKFQTITNLYEVIKNPKTKPIYAKKEILAKDWLSRILQHEIDHLDGKLFINLGGKKLKESDFEAGEAVVD